MKALKITSLCGLVFLLGCANVIIPNYIKDVHPYKEKFYADFDHVLEVTKETLAEMGWKVDNSSDPSVFEHSEFVETPGAKQILIYTDSRQTSLIIASSYTRINVFIRSGIDNVTEVELRYMIVTSYPFKTFYNYRNDRSVHKIFDKIKAKLG